ncbi:hypothetical protein ACFLQZ_00445 [Acidobacteriota bacterium]
MIENISVSEGKELQFRHPGTAEIEFESYGENPVKNYFYGFKRSKRNLVKRI